MENVILKLVLYPFIENIMIGVVQNQKINRSISFHRKIVKVEKLPSFNSKHNDWNCVKLEDKSLKQNATIEYVTLKLGL